MALLPRVRVTEAVPWGMGTHPLPGQDTGMGCGDTPAATPSSPSHFEDVHLHWSFGQ